MSTAAGVRAGERDTGEPALDLVFGSGGNADEHLWTGLSHPEPGQAWLVGEDSSAVLPRPGCPGTYRLHLVGRPFLHPGRIEAQRLAVSVNGSLLQPAVLDGPFSLEWLLPWALLAACETLRLELRHPDAGRPSALIGARDARRLALALTRLQLTRVRSVAAVWHPPVLAPRIHASPASGRDLLLRFESLGHDCELGMLQRAFDAEPPGLLRFAGTSPPALIALLDREFAAIGDPADVEIARSDPDLLVRQTRYGFSYHTWLREALVDPVAVHARECRRMRLLADKLLRDLREGEKLFVYKARDAEERTFMAALHAAVRRYGPNTLLWIERQDAAHAAGTLRVECEGLLRGWLDRYAPPLAIQDASRPCWLDLCARAWSLARGGAEARTKP
ncbi:MAG: hypothetical protein JO209_06970 [Acidisphaera sp.]|nr:hypothetical protein [Acidisphaera sp.]